jgi:hypothetical protein
VCGCSVAIQRHLGTAPSFWIAGLDLNALDAAASGRGLPARCQEEPEFPPLGDPIRSSELPFQYDTWLPRREFRSGELIPVYYVLRNRTDSPQRIVEWHTYYIDEHEHVIRGQLGPDGTNAVALGLYRVEEQNRTRVISKLPWNADYYMPQHNIIPPRGALIFVMLLNGPFDMSTPGEYEIRATYPSDYVEEGSQHDTFHGYIPAPPVRFRVLPPVPWRRRALFALPILGFAVAGWMLRRRRAAP